jgi:tRNA A-37 threonylcarbamoyl transferase component Bud32
MYNERNFKKHGSFWYIHGEAQNQTSPFFDTLDNAFSCEGELISSSAINRVIKFYINGTGYYVKTYTAGGKRFRRYIGRSKVRSEWENLLFFKKLGIPVPELVACGQDIHLGLFNRGAIITNEVKNSSDLATLARNESDFIKNKAWMEYVGLLYSDYAKRIHQNKFIHADLKWRNILVTKDSKPEVYFIDCPTGRKLFGPFFNHWRIKDLACLDQIARDHLKGTTRLKLYKNYTGRNNLSEKDKKIIRKILSWQQKH